MPRRASSTKADSLKNPLSALTLPGRCRQRCSTPSTSGSSDLLVMGILGDPLLHDQVVFADGDLGRVAQRESPAVAQKPAVRIAVRTARHSALAQAFQAPRNLLQPLLQGLHLLRLHALASRLLRTGRIALLLPAANLP